MRSVAHTNCDGNGNSGYKPYAYRDGDCDSNSNSNTDADTYADPKGYSDAETSADSATTPVSGEC